MGILFGTEGAVGGNSSQGAIGGWNSALASAIAIKDFEVRLEASFGTQNCAIKQEEGKSLGATVVTSDNPQLNHCLMILPSFRKNFLLDGRKAYVAFGGIEPPSIGFAEDKYAIRNPIPFFSLPYGNAPVTLTGALVYLPLSDHHTLSLMFAQNNTFWGVAPSVFVGDEYRNGIFKGILVAMSQVKKDVTGWSGSHLIDLALSVALPKVTLSLDANYLAQVDPSGTHHYGAVAAAMSASLHRVVSLNLRAETGRLAAPADPNEKDPGIQWRLAGYLNIGGTRVSYPYDEARRPSAWKEANYNPEEDETDLTEKDFKTDNPASPEQISKNNKKKKGKFGRGGRGVSLPPALTPAWLPEAQGALAERKNRKVYGSLTGFVGLGVNGTELRTEFFVSAGLRLLTGVGN